MLSKQQIAYISIKACLESEQILSFKVIRKDYWSLSNGFGYGTMIKNCLYQFYIFHILARHAGSDQLDGPVLCFLTCSECTNTTGQDQEYNLGHEDQWLTLSWSCWPSGTELRFLYCISRPSLFLSLDMISIHCKYFPISSNSHRW